MRFLRDAVITVLVLVAIVCIVGFTTLKAGGMSADQEPGGLEHAIATRLVKISVPSESRSAVNPFANNADAWQTAVAHYEDHCATCHGGDGRGHTEMGEHMYPRVPDLAGPVVQQLSDGTLFYIIQNGVRWTGMPGWKSEHEADETWRLVSLVRHMPSMPVSPEHGHEHEHH